MKRHAFSSEKRGSLWDFYPLSIEEAPLVEREKLNLNTAVRKDR